MPIAVEFDFPTEPVEKYERVFEAGGDAITNQPGRLFHVCYRNGDGFRVVDVWEEAAFESFGPVIGPATAKAGLDAQPRVYPVQGYVRQDGSRNGGSAPAAATVAGFYAALGELWADGNADRLDDVLAADFTHHLPGMPADREGLKMALLGLRQALPDFSATVNLMTTSGDLVADSITWSATHQGELMGVPPTGKRVTVTETHIARVRDGKIVERWGNWDQFGLMEQLGVVGAPA